MSQSEAGELLSAVSAFLRKDVLPQVDGFSGYTTRVAINSLAIVERELKLGAGLQEIDRQAAIALGIDPEEGPVSQQVATRLCNGDMAVSSTLVTYLKRRTLKALEIDNPKYSGYRQACERWAGDFPGKETP